MPNCVADWQMILAVFIGTHGSLTVPEPDIGRTTDGAALGAACAVPAVATPAAAVVASSTSAAAPTFDRRERRELKRILSPNH